VHNINGAPLFHLGWSVGVLGDRLLTPGETLATLATPALNAASNLEILARETAITLPLSQGAASHFANQLREIFSADNLTERGQGPLTPSDQDSITGNISHFSSVLWAELGRSNIFFISRKRAWDMTTLVWHAEDILPQAIAATISDQCRYDIREAGRCIAFDLHTALGFHVFRAIETVILGYFPTLGIEPPAERNLGAYIRLLEGAEIDERITGMVRHLKDFYRNPLIHPDWVLEAEDAENLFQVASSAITAIMQDIGRRSTPAATAPGP
jgi:hypothetical protein